MGESASGPSRPGPRFWAMGAPAPRSFPTLPDSNDIRNLQLINTTYLEPIREIILLARDHGFTDAVWVRDLEVCLHRNQDRLMNQKPA